MDIRIGLAIPIQGDLDMAKITVLSPVAAAPSGKAALPAWPAALSGLTIGFLDNTKHNFDRLVTDIGRQLQERFGVGGVVYARKANAATAAAPEIIESLAKQCDLVFSGSAD